ncbi:MAG: iron ABC transporter permease [Firmicutes bacterium]|jgi:iron complex transport system permease protein|nr:iron ABC transporter permease [Bacillota bacterium]NBI61721.1 iron ABC transporter permease [Clostridiales bacterium]
MEREVTEQHKEHNLIKAAVLVLLPIFFFLAAVCVGRYSVSAGDVCKSFWTAAFGTDLGVNDQVFSVVMNLRVPRALQGLLVGASLAVSGACFQSLFRNPLVSSGMLGVSNGAGFGAALSILLFNSMTMTAVFSFGFGTLAVVLAYLTGKVSGGTPTITLVLGGTIIQSIFSALLSLLKYIADPYSQLPAITFWLMGSLASTKSEELLFSAIPMVVGIIGMILFRWRLNVLSMGDREARTLGLNVGLNKGIVIGLATLATAGAVCVSGVIGWVGLVVPHMCRMVIGSDNKWLIPASISIGACFMVFVDTICRTITGAEIPLGIVTAIVGGPFFIYLLKKTKGKNW